MKNILRIAAMGAALATSFALAMPASAAGRPEGVVTRVVKYGDLNLNTTEGAQALYDRLYKASWRVCRDVIGGSGIAALQDRSVCMREVVEAAVRDVNKPTLTAVHQGKTLELTATR